MWAVERPDGGRRTRLHRRPLPRQLAKRQVPQGRAERDCLVGQGRSAGRRRAFDCRPGGDRSSPRSQACEALGITARPTAHEKAPCHDAVATRGLLLVAWDERRLSLASLGGGGGRAGRRSHFARRLVTADFTGRRAVEWPFESVRAGRVPNSKSPSDDVELFETAAAGRAACCRAVE